MTATKPAHLTGRCLAAARALLGLDPVTDLTRAFLAAALESHLSAESLAVLNSGPHHLPDLLTAPGLAPAQADQLTGRDRRLVAAARLLSCTVPDAAPSALPRRMHLVCDLVKADYKMLPAERIFPERAEGTDPQQPTLELPDLLAS